MSLREGTASLFYFPANIYVARPRRDPHLQRTLPHTIRTRRMGGNPSGPILSPPNDQALLNAVDFADNRR